MRHKSFIALAISLILLMVGSVAGYAYDQSRDDLIAEGVRVGGIDLGGMRAGEARAELERRLAEPLRGDVTVKVEAREFTLSADKAEIRTDVEGMVQAALAASRDGGILSRMVRYVTGDDVDAAIEPKVTWSREAVAGLVDRIERRVEREPKDAEVKPTASGLESAKHRNGLAVRAKELERKLNAELGDPDADRVVAARTKTVKPDVTTGELAERYPYFIVVNRSEFKLRFYKDLELAKTYTIAVGQVGYETPVGLYHIQNKAVNPAWHVPEREWAGSLAGQVIPGGTAQNPLKARWMGIYNGAGIHGTDATGSLGSRASHGCIRMSIPDVKELYDEIPVRTPVYIA